MNSKGLYILLIFIITMSSACDRKDAQIVIAEIRTNEQLLLEFREHFDLDGQVKIIAKIGTTETYECDRGSLRNTVVRNGIDAILINVIGLDFPPAGECERQDIAAAEINLGSLELNKSYELQISLLDEIKAIGSIIINGDRIKISMPSDAEENGILVKSNEVRKVPGNVVWGFIDDEGINSDTTLFHFINQIEGFGSPVDYIGEFGHFQIEQDGTAQIYDFEKRVATQQNQGFAIHFDGDFQEIRDLIDNEYCLGENRIRIFNTNGEIISCN